MGKLLEAIGVHTLTNREALMEELDKLDDETFVYMVLSRMSDLPENIEDARCQDCKAEHGGLCVNLDDEPCPISTAEWLSMPCTHERLIKEEVPA